jgi:hypothetical protein
MLHCWSMPSNEVLATDVRPFLDIIDIKVFSMTRIYPPFALVEVDVRFDEWNEIYVLHRFRFLLPAVTIACSPCTIFCSNHFAKFRHYYYCRK